MELKDRLVSLTLLIIKQMENSNTQMQKVLIITRSVIQTTKTCLILLV